MSDINSTTFSGNLGQDPEYKIFNDNSKKVIINIACTKTWKDATTGERKESTTWVRCEGWNRWANYIEACHTKKGDSVLVVCEYKVEQYVDNQTGEKKYASIFLIKDFHRLSKTPKPSEVVCPFCNMAFTPKAKTANENQQQGPTQDELDDLAF